VIGRASTRCEWARASDRGDGVSGNFDTTARVRAGKFLLHPLLRDDIGATGGFWSNVGDHEDARKLARAAQARLNSSLKNVEKKARTSTLLKQSHGIVESVAHLIHKGLRSTPRAARGKGDHECDYVATTPRPPL
jgi:hypothetical protein